MGLLLLPCLLQTGVGVMRKSPQHNSAYGIFSSVSERVKLVIGFWSFELRKLGWYFSVMICRKENIIQQRGSRPRIYLVSVKIHGVQNDQFNGLLMVRFQLFLNTKSTS